MAPPQPPAWSRSRPASQIDPLQTVTPALLQAGNVKELTSRCRLAAPGQASPGRRHRASNRPLARHVEGSGRHIIEQMRAARRDNQNDKAELPPYT